MHPARIFVPTLLLACGLLGGCAVGRSEIKMSSPVATAPAAPATGRVVVIRSVTDERHFEQAPSDPSIPSLGEGGVEKASADEKARAVARKRGGYGMALGDILLAPGQTAAGLVREDFVAALQQAGYSVAPDAAAPAGAVVVDVHLKQFWEWFTPGFSSIKIDSSIQTEIDVEGSGKPLVVSVRDRDAGMLATEAMWIRALEKTRADYRAQLSTQLSAHPF